MISKKSLGRIAELLKLPVEKINEAVAAEKETDIEIPDALTVITNDELTQRDNNNKVAGKKEGETIGEEKGKELAVKAMKNKLGITDPSKDPEVVAGLIQQKIAGDNALQEQVALLQADLKKKDDEITGLKSNFDMVKGDAELLSLLPSNKSNALETSEHLDIVKKNLEFTTDGVKYKGEVLRDTQTKNVLDKKAAVEYFYTQRPGLLETDEQAKGRGGKGSPGGTGKFKTLKEARISWEADHSGQNWGNLESQDYMQKILKENPDLVMEDDGS